MLILHQSKQQPKTESLKKQKIETILSGVMMVMAIALFVSIMYMRLSGKEVQLFGFSVYKVATDSMEPELMVGDVILVKDTEASTLEVGDILTYRGVNGLMTDLPITHKLITEPILQEDGSYLLYTCGIREGATIDEPFTDDRLLGKYVGTLHILSFFYSIFETPAGLLLLILPILVLVVLEIRNIKEECHTIEEESQNGKKEQSHENQELSHDNLGKIENK